MRTLVIHNPRAGGGRIDGIRECTGVLGSAGWNVDLVLTEREGSATELAKRAVQESYDLVVVAGGDGTVNEALQPLVGSSTALAVLPFGTANLFVRDTRSALNPVEAAKALTAGHARIADVGLAAGHRYFLLFAGIGFDAAVIHAVDTELKRRTGPLSYVVAGIASGPGYNGAPANIFLDGKRLKRHLLMMVVANTPSFAMVPLSKTARIDDGLFDVWIFHGRGFWTKLIHVLSVFLRFHRESETVDSSQHRRIAVRTRRHLPVELDGEPFGFTPMTFEIIPAALRVWLPAPSTLWHSPAEKGRVEEVVKLED